MVVTAIPHAKGGSDSAARRETSDDYGHAICQSDGHRIIVCRDGIQWIIQSKVASEKLRATARWKAIKYMRTKKALMAFWHTLHKAQTCKYWPALDALPDTFAEGEQ